MAFIVSRTNVEHSIATVKASYPFLGLVENGSELKRWCGGLNQSCPIDHQCAEERYASSCTLVAGEAVLLPRKRKARQCRKKCAMVVDTFVVRAGSVAVLSSFEAREQKVLGERNF
jgi:hypothetical protein